MPEADEAGNTSGDTAAAEEFQPITTQDDLNKVIGERVRRATAKYADYQSFKEKAEQFDVLQAANQTEQQRATQALTAAEQRAVEAESRALRLEIAADKGLTPAQAKRLVGASREELEADADELLTTFKPTTVADDQSRQVAASLDLGTRGTSTASDSPEAIFGNWLSGEMKSH